MDNQQSLMRKMWKRRSEIPSYFSLVAVGIVVLIVAIVGAVGATRGQNGTGFIQHWQEMTPLPLSQFAENPQRHDDSTTVVRTGVVVARDPVCSVRLLVVPLPSWLKMKHGSIKDSWLSVLMMKRWKIKLLIYW